MRRGTRKERKPKGTIRALSLTQPWCGLVASGIKTVENRTRPTVAAKHIGARFALHATRETDERVLDKLVVEARDLFVDASSNERWWRLSKIHGAVIGMATLRAILDIREMSEISILALLHLHGVAHQFRFTFGPHVYVLGDVEPLPDAVPCGGALGFWTLDADVEALVRAQFEAAA